MQAAEITYFPKISLVGIGGVNGTQYVLADSNCPNELETADTPGLAFAALAVGAVTQQRIRPSCRRAGWHARAKAGSMRHSPKGCKLHRNAAVWTSSLKSLA